MKSLGSLLFLLLSSGQCYVHLSARKHRATSTTCLTTSQQLGEVDADSECDPKCSLSCDMIVQTDVRQDKEAKRFLFVISEVELVEAADENMQVFRALGEAVVHDDLDPEWHVTLLDEGHYQHQVRVEVPSVFGYVLLFGGAHVVEEDEILQGRPTCSVEWTWTGGDQPLVLDGDEV